MRPCLFSVLVSNACGANPGEILWNAALDGRVSSSPCLIGEFVCAGTEAESLYALGRTNGEVIFSEQLGEAARAYISVDRAGQRIYISSGRVIAFDELARQVVWRGQLTPEFIPLERWQVYSIHPFQLHCAHESNQPGLAR